MQVWWGRFFLVHEGWCTGTLHQIYREMTSSALLGFARTNPDLNPVENSWSQTKNMHQHDKNNIKSGGETNCVKGLEQHHFRVPPVSLGVDAKACTGGGGCPR